jgi:predicted dinucleotide-binding enzyme
MNIGLLGSGNVAKHLGAGFLKRGHGVMLGTRDPAKLAQWQGAEGNGSSVGSFADAAAFGDVVVVATLAAATLDVLAAVGPEKFDGKIVMDATNPLRFDESGPHLTVGFTDSLGEQVQRALPRAHVVKVFNTVGAEFMVDPQFAGGPPDMFIAGDDERAKKVVAHFANDFGWNAIDMGGIERSRELEALCIVWVTYGFRSGHWDHAFKFIRSDAPSARL